MGKGAVWAFAFGAIVIMLVMGWVQAKVQLGTAVGLGINLGIFGTMGYLGVYLTKATKGQGIVAFLVSSLVLAIASYAVMSFLFGHATSQLTTQVGTLGGANEAETARVAAAAGSVMGGVFGIIVAVVAFLISFISGLVGCLIGGSAKNKVVGAAGVGARAAA
jgi:hypothetical protein